MALLEELKTAWHSGGMKGLGVYFLGRDVHPLMQFTKYGVAGVIATATHVAVFYALSHWVLEATDPALGSVERSWRAAVNNTVAFLFSNTVAYLLNAAFVFTRGRHAGRVELMLFFVVSGVSLLLALAVSSGVLIRLFDASTHIAVAANVVTSVMVNFVCRKFLVFQK